MPTLINEHITDTSLNNGRIKRKISNWQNYSLPDGKFRQSAPVLQTMQSIPDDWEGDCDFDACQTHSACQSFTQNSNKQSVPFWGLRVSNRPDIWINWRAIDARESVPIVNENSRTWTDAWPGCDLRVTTLPEGARKEIIIKDRHSPTKFGFSLLMSEGMTYKFARGIIIFLDCAGEEIFRTLPVWGKDSATTTLFGKQHVRCSFTQDEKLANKFPTFWIEPNGDDLSHSIYPVIIDPDTTIIDYTTIVDGSISDYMLDGNYGWDEMPIGTNAGFILKGLVRFDKSLIPSGSLSGFRYNFNMEKLGGEYTDNCNPIAFLIKSANTWGNSITGFWDSIVEGEPCWGFAKYDSQAWDGSVGCSTSGVDYVADASPPTINFTTVGWKTMTLPPSWLTVWRDGVNNGILLRDDLAEGYWGPWSVERYDPALRPYFEIDYGGAAAEPTIYRPRRKIFYKVI